MMRGDYQLTVQMIASFWKIITEDLDMLKGCKNGIKTAHDDQKEYRMQVNQNIIKFKLTCFVAWSLVIIRHWFLNKTQKLSARSVNGSSRHQCCRKQKSHNQKSVMFNTFVDVRRIVNSELLPQGLTINLQIFKEILPTASLQKGNIHHHPQRVLWIWH